MSAASFRDGWPELVGDLAPLELGGPGGFLGEDRGDEGRLYCMYQRSGGMDFWMS
jgi:hypothetical protein